MSNKRARSEEALARAEETGHAATRASVYICISLYQTLRGDPEAVTRTAKMAVDLGREHEMALDLAWGEVLVTLGARPARGSRKRDDGTPRTAGGAHRLFRAYARRAPAIVAFSEGGIERRRLLSL
jgi:hypothetical protein